MNAHSFLLFQTHSAQISLIMYSSYRCERSVEETGRRRPSSCFRLRGVGFQRPSWCRLWIMMGADRIKVARSITWSYFLNSTTLFAWCFGLWFLRIRYQWSCTSCHLPMSVDSESGSLWDISIPRHRRHPYFLFRKIQ